MNLRDCTGFDWDEGNLKKNWYKHGVSRQEAEQVFQSERVMIHQDLLHSDVGARYIALGATAEGRRLFVSFAIRGLKIRIISARPMSRKEREMYDA
jgi:uncharacterized DUF497 family protein